MEQDKKEYNIPSTEKLQVKYYDHLNILRYIITRHIMLLDFYLYQVDGDKLKKIATNSAPEFKKLEKDKALWEKELEKIEEVNIDG